MGSPCTWLALKPLKKRPVVRVDVSIQTILDTERETEVVVMGTLLVLSKAI